jgi:hypothetical protein
MSQPTVRAVIAFDVIRSILALRRITCMHLWFYSPERLVEQPFSSVFMAINNSDSGIHEHASICTILSWSVERTV